MSRTHWQPPSPTVVCNDSPDSLVKKNVVRDSKQRGYVVHLTNNVTLEENVAYDITGHAYCIEDGAGKYYLVCCVIFDIFLSLTYQLLPLLSWQKPDASSGAEETELSITRPRKRRS